MSDAHHQEIAVVLAHHGDEFAETDDAGPIIVGDGSENLSTGTVFKTYWDFKKVLDHHCSVTGNTFIKNSAHTVMLHNKCAASEKGKYPEDWKYIGVAFLCKHFGTHKSKSTGQRKRLSVKTGCSATVRLGASKRRGGLVVLYSNLTHTGHDVANDMLSRKKRRKSKALPGDKEVLHVSVPLRWTPEKCKSLIPGHLSTPVPNSEEKGLCAEPVVIKQQSRIDKEQGQALREQNSNGNGPHKNQLPREASVESPSFTVAQVELIRRLRNSGVTCQRIVEAFQEFDQIDKELGSLYTIPTTSNTTAHIPSLLHTVRNSAIPCVEVVKSSHEGLPDCISMSSDLTSRKISAVCDNTDGTHLSTDNSRVDTEESWDHLSRNHDMETSHCDKQMPKIDTTNNESNAEKRPDFCACVRCILSQRPKVLAAWIQRCAETLPDFEPTNIRQTIPDITEEAAVQILHGNLEGLNVSVGSRVLSWLMDNLCRTDWFWHCVDLKNRTDETEPVTKDVRQKLQQKLYNR